MDLLREKSWILGKKGYVLSLKKRMRCFSQYITVFLEKDRNVSGERPACFLVGIPLKKRTHAFSKKGTCFLKKACVLFFNSFSVFY